MKNKWKKNKDKPLKPLNLKLEKQLLLIDFYSLMMQK